MNEKLHTEGHGQGSTVDIEVFAPSEVEPRRFTFKKNELVSAVAQAVAQALGYNAASPTLQNAEHEVLDRTKNLAASGIKDGDILELVDAGGGV